MEAVLTTSSSYLHLLCKFLLHVHVLNKLLIHHLLVGFHICGDKEVV